MRGGPAPLTLEALGFTTKLPFVMTAPPPNHVDWDTAESQIMLVLEPDLRDLAMLAQDADAVAERSIIAVRDSVAAFSLSAQVHMRLLIRIAQDLRAVVLLAQRGHTLQAVTIASTIHEQAHAIGYIGEDEARAQQWLQHTEEGRSYPHRISDAIAATAGVLGDPGYTESSKYHYRQLCMGKHANPLLQRDFGVRMELGVMHVQRGPFKSRYTVALARLAIDLSIRHVLLAVMLWARVRVRDDLAEALAGELSRIHDELEVAKDSFKAETERLLDASADE